MHLTCSHRTRTAALRMALGASFAVLATLPLSAGEPSLLLGTGYGGLRHPPHKVFASVELQYEFGPGPWGLWATVDAGNDEKFVGLGLLLEWRLGPDWRIGVSSGPGYYSNLAPLDLGSHLEFRSSLYLTRRLGGRYRLGLSVSHYSNAGTAAHNPGAETMRIFLAVPLR